MRQLFLKIFKPIHGFLRYNFVIASLLFCILFLPDFIIKFFVQTHVVFEPLYALEFFGFLILLSFCGRTMIVGVTVLFGLMELINLCYMAYFGQSISASELNNIILEHRDTFDPAYLRQTWFVPLTIFLFYGMGLFLFWNASQKSVRFRFMFVVVFYLMAHKPLHALRETKGIWYFQPGPTRSSINNSINVFSYYFFQYLPKGMQTSEISYQPYEVVETAPTADNVLVIFGESLAASHMPFYGYQRATFPQLAALLQERDLLTPPHIYTFRTGSFIGHLNSNLDTFVL